MINAILNGIINLIMVLVKFITIPIDLIISNTVPSISTALTSFGEMLAIISKSMGWCISLLGISTSALSLIVLYYTFKLTAPILFSSIKSAIKWYKSLKP